MKIGVVSGNVVSTINHPFFAGRRLMICDLISPDGEPDGESGGESDGEPEGEAGDEPTSG